MAELARTSKRGFQNQTRTSAIAVDTTSGDSRANVLSQLGKFSEVLYGEENRKQQAEIETRKALGASRAANDLTKAEQHRQGISEDDALATKLSYNAIVGQHDTMKAGNSYAEWYQSNPDANDDEISAKKTELYQPLFEKYGGDSRSLKQVSLQVQESQYKLVGIENQIKSTHQQAKNKEALGISISDLMATPDADIDSILDSEIPARAKALGLTEFDYKSAIMSSAAVSANEGDDRLLRKLKTVDWAKDSASIEKAQSSFDRFVAREQSPAIGDAMGSIEIENTSLSVPWTTTLRKVETLNKQYPSTYSASRIASMKAQRDSAVAKRSKTTDGVTDSFAIYHNQDVTPLANNPAYSDNERKLIIKELDASWANKTRELVAGGMDSADANSYIMKDQMKWSRLNRLTIPSLQASLNASLNLSLDELPSGDKLPAHATNGMVMLKNMDSTALELYLPSKGDTAFALNFKHFSENMSDEQAYRRADRIKRNPYKVSPEQRQEQRDVSSNIIKDRLTNGFFEMFSDKDVQRDVPQWQIDQLTNRWNDDAEQVMYAGGFDAKSNTNQSVDTNLAKSSQMFNGTIINQTSPDLYNNISQGRPMAQSKTQDYVEAFVLSSAPAIKAAYGIEVPPEDLTLNFSRDGTTFTMLDRNGEQVGAIFSTESIYPIGRDADMKALRGLNITKEAQAAREAINNLNTNLTATVLTGKL